MNGFLDKINIDDLSVRIEPVTFKKSDYFSISGFMIYSSDLSKIVVFDKNSKTPVKFVKPNLFFFGVEEEEIYDIIAATQFKTSPEMFFFPLYSSAYKLIQEYKLNLNGFPQKTVDMIIFDIDQELG